MPYIRINFKFCTPRPTINRDDNPTAYTWLIAYLLLRIKEVVISTTTVHCGSPDALMVVVVVMVVVWYSLPIIEPLQVVLLCSTTDKLGLLQCQVPVLLKRLTQLES